MSIKLSHGYYGNSFPHGFGTEQCILLYNAEIDTHNPTYKKLGVISVELGWKLFIQ